MEPRGDRTPDLYNAVRTATTGTVSFTNTPPFFVRTNTSSHISSQALGFSSGNVQAVHYRPPWSAIFDRPGAKIRCQIAGVR